MCGVVMCVFGVLCVVFGVCGVWVCAYIPCSHVVFLWSHSRWLDSSKTLYEQDVKEGDLLYMRFKYYSFMGIDARVRGIWRG